MTYTFHQLQSSVRECTSYDLMPSCDGDGEFCYLLIDPFGDQDGDPFYSLDDVTDFITNNVYVDQYLYELTQQIN